MLPPTTPPLLTPPDLGNWITFREWDQTQRATKGSAFRRFKALLPELVEGQDFLHLDRDAHAEHIAQLRSGNRLYSSSVHAVLLSPRLTARMLADDGN